MPAPTAKYNPTSNFPPVSRVKRIKVQNISAVFHRKHSAKKKISSLLHTIEGEDSYENIGPWSCSQA
jgi:hypothetical protein